VMPTNTAAVPTGSRITSSATSETKKVSRDCPVGSQSSCRTDRRGINSLADSGLADNAFFNDKGPRQGKWHLPSCTAILQPKEIAVLNVASN
jgi:hypothetical protein